MSEEERAKRFDYREYRTRWITIQAIAVAVVLTMAIIAAFLAHAFNKTYYVSYSEKSNVNYGALLKDNDFYDESYLGKDYAYIASLIDKVHAEFNYKIDMDSVNPIDFSYTTSVNAVVRIKNTLSGKVIFAPVYNEVPEESYTVSDTGVSVYQAVAVDYVKYNELAKRFIDTYELTGVTAELLLEMRVKVTGTSEEFDKDTNTNSYVASISVPLTEQTVEVKITSAIPASEEKILSYTTENESQIFKAIAIIFGSFGIALALVLCSFAYFSRNLDITYDIKVTRLVRSYRSFIQKICNEFDTSGYHVLKISSFNEMLDIRDIIQSPILMEENRDRTCTKFFIPTNTKLLYLFEIKVDDYDDIYGVSDDADELCDPDEDDGGDCAGITIPEELQCPEMEFVEQIEKQLDFADEQKAEDAETHPEVVEPEPIEEELPVIEQEPVIEEETVIIVDEPTVTATDATETEAEASEPDADDVETIDFVDENGRRLNVTCKRSFTANLIQSNKQIKDYYSALKNHILSYKGVKAKVSWKLESYKKGRVQLFKLKIRGKTICLYCALNPDDFDKAKYFHERSEAKAFEAVPMLVRVRSDMGLKKAIRLIDHEMAMLAIPKTDNIPTNNYAEEYPYETTKHLVERGLIKLLFPGAVAAEPKSHHHEYKKKTVVKKEDGKESFDEADKKEEAPQK